MKPEELKEVNIVKLIEKHYGNMIESVLSEEQKKTFLKATLYYQQNLKIPEILDDTVRFLFNFVVWDFTHTVRL